MFVASTQNQGVVPISAVWVKGCARMLGSTAFGHNFVQTPPNVVLQPVVHGK